MLCSILYILHIQWTACVYVWVCLQVCSLLATEIYCCYSSSSSCLFSSNCNIFLQSYYGTHSHTLGMTSYSRNLFRSRCCYFGKPQTYVIQIKCTKVQQLHLCWAPEHSPAINNHNMSISHNWVFYECMIFVLIWQITTGNGIFPILILIKKWNHTHKRQLPSSFSFVS